MIDFLMGALGKHAIYIVLSYVSFVGILGGLILSSFIKMRQAKRILNALQTAHYFSQSSEKSPNAE
jgi:heme exporter protein CcmD